MYLHAAHSQAVLCGLPVQALGAAAHTQARGVQGGGALFDAGLQGVVLALEAGAHVGEDLQRADLARVILAHGEVPAQVVELCLHDAHARLVPASKGVLEARRNASQSRAGVPARRRASRTGAR